MMRVVPYIIAGRPHVAEHDFSGVVVDANGTNLNTGDSVYGWIVFMNGFLQVRSLHHCLCIIDSVKSPTTAHRSTTKD